MSKLPQIPYQQYARLNQERSLCLRHSDNLRVLAKTSISLLTKNQIDQAEKNLPEMKKIFGLIQEKLNKNPFLHSFAGINDGPEEYLESLFLYHYIKRESMPTVSSLKINPEIFLSALSDFTGELVRLAHQNEKEVKTICEYLEKIYQLSIPVSVTRNTAIRTKMENIGHNLKKIESIIYDLKLRDKIT